MFDNIGKKIKGFAEIMFFLEAFATAITGVILIANDVSYGILLLLLGPLVAWISSWFLYGFGQLIENSDMIAEACQRQSIPYKKNASVTGNCQQVRVKAKESAADSVLSEDAYFDITCPNCSEQLSFTKSALQSEEGICCPFCDAAISLK